MGDGRGEEREAGAEYEPALEPHGSGEQQHRKPQLGRRVVADEMLVERAECGDPVAPCAREVLEERARRHKAPDPDLGLHQRDKAETQAARPSHRDAASAAVPTPAAAVASRAASIALAHAISDRQPGAATMSPARKTPSPRSTEGRSRQVLPGRSSAPVRPSM